MFHLPVSIGITCAQKLNEQMPDCNIKIYAKETSPNTTSDVSAGVFSGFWGSFYNASESNEEKTKAT